jgi:hypothetical protein
MANPASKRLSHCESIDDELEILSWDWIVERLGEHVSDVDFLVTSAMFFSKLIRSYVHMRACCDSL